MKKTTLMFNSQCLSCVNVFVVIRLIWWHTWKTISHFFFFLIQQYRQLGEGERSNLLCLHPCPRYLLSIYLSVADRRRSRLHITHQPRTFLLISSNRGIVSRKRWKRGDMSVIVWSVFKWDSRNVVYSLHLEEKRGLCLTRFSRSTMMQAKLCVF